MSTFLIRLAIENYARSPCFRVFLPKRRTLCNTPNLRLLLLLSVVLPEIRRMVNVVHLNTDFQSMTDKF